VSCSRRGAWTCRGIEGHSLKLGVEGRHSPSDQDAWQTGVAEVQMNKCLPIVSRSCLSFVPRCDHEPGGVWLPGHG
jgi:hypothetical protein